MKFTLFELKTQLQPSKKYLQIDCQFTIENHSLKVIIQSFTLKRTFFFEKNLSFLLFESLGI